MIKIHGIDLDEQGRCTHWHSPFDIVALRCSVCGKYYACYECHDELEDHPFGQFNQNKEDGVMCGACGHTMTYQEHISLGHCPKCNSEFNPRCINHKDKYVCS